MRPEDLIACFLEDAGYESIAQWAEDSDYVWSEGEWWTEGHRVDIQECILDAIEACGYSPVDQP